MDFPRKKIMRSAMGDIEIPVGGVRVVIKLPEINCISEDTQVIYTIPVGYKFAPCVAFALNKTTDNQNAFITTLEYEDDGGRSVTNENINTNQPNEISMINFDLFQAQVSGGFLIAGQQMRIRKPETIEATPVVEGDVSYIIAPYVEGILIKV
jgi:hypothetical protein